MSEQFPCICRCKIIWFVAAISCAILASAILYLLFDDSKYRDLDDAGLYEAAGLQMFVGNNWQAQRMIKRMTDVNVEVDGATLLQTAVLFSTSKVVKLLVERGANVNAVDRWGSTPLGFAYRSGNEEMMKVLIQNGADKSVVEKKDNESVGDNEIVMTPGMEITATTTLGMITIRAETALKRSYTWEGATRWVVMGRRNERWHGIFGLYWPGTGNHWKKHNGIKSALTEEGQQDFENAEAAMGWIHSRTYIPTSFVRMLLG